MYETLLLKLHCQFCSSPKFPLKLPGTRETTLRVYGRLRTNPDIKYEKKEMNETDKKQKKYQHRCNDNEKGKSEQPNDCSNRR